MSNLALALLMAAAPSQDQAKVDAKLTLSERNGTWVFAIDGTTDLPAGTVLRVRICAVTLLDDPVHGPMEDEEPLVRADENWDPPVRRFKVAAGRLRGDVHAFARKPYSLLYRARIRYAPEDQTDAVTLKAGDAEFERKADVRAGTDLDLEAEMKERALEIRTDLMAMEGLGEGLKEWIDRAGKEPAKWKAWKESTSVSINALLEKNLLRFSLWAVWPEYQARMRIRAMGEFLDRLLESAERDPDRARRLLAGFEEAMDEAVTRIGVDLPLDGRTAGPAFAAYERAVAPLRGGPDSAAARRRIRAEGVEALFDLLRVIRTRHRAYVYVNDLSARFTRVFQLLDAEAPGSEIQAALDAHDAALREFRRHAGLP